MYMNNYLNDYQRSILKLVLTSFLGFLGIYRFSKKQIGMGLLYFFTYGLFLIGWFYDIYLAYGDYKLEKSMLTTDKKISQNTNCLDLMNKDDHISDVSATELKTDSTILDKLNALENAYLKYRNDASFYTLIKNFVDKKIYEYGRYVEYFQSFIYNEKEMRVFFQKHPMMGLHIYQFIKNVYTCSYPFNFIHDITQLSSKDLEEKYNKNEYFLINFTNEQISNYNEFFSSLINTERISQSFVDKFAIHILINECKIEKLKKAAKKDIIDKFDIDPNESDERIINSVLTYNIDFDKGFLSDYLAVIKEINSLSFFERTCQLDEKIKTIHKRLSGEVYLSNLIKNKSTTHKKDISDIDIMSGSEFENFTTKLFISLGYKAERTKASGDQGIDVIAEHNGTKYAIQTKCYSKPVGNHAIMEAVAGAKYYNADKIMVVTNSTFTKSARELAESNNVILWDRSILKEKLEEI